jgi:hypothetical protein
MRSTFLDCPYKFFCEYVRRLTPIYEADYFRWGRLVHNALHYQDIGEDPLQACDELMKEAEIKCWPPFMLQETEEMCELLPTVMDAHLLRFHEDDEHYELLGGEEYEGKFSLELPSGWLFQGKIDKIVRDIRRGKVLNWERKTAKTVDDTYFEDVLLDSQPRGYLLATQRMKGFVARDALYEMIGKPGIKHKQWQTREMYIQELKDKYLLDNKKLMIRRRMPFEQEDIDAYYWEIDQVTQMIQWCLDEGIWPKHHPRNRIGGCGYKPLCLRGDESKYRVRSMDAFNPELV